MGSPADRAALCHESAGHRGRRGDPCAPDLDGARPPPEAALDAGVHDYLLKPIDRRTLTIRLAIAEQRSLAAALF